MLIISLYGLHFCYYSRPYHACISYINPPSLCLGDDLIKQKNFQLVLLGFSAFIRLGMESHVLILYILISITTSSTLCGKQSSPTPLIAILHTITLLWTTFTTYCLIFYFVLEQMQEVYPNPRKHNYPKVLLK